MANTLELQAEAWFEYFGSWYDLGTVDFGPLTVYGQFFVASACPDGDSIPQIYGIQNGNNNAAGFEWFWQADQYYEGSTYYAEGYYEEYTGALAGYSCIICDTGGCYTDLAHDWPAYGMSVASWQAAGTYQWTISFAPYYG